MSSLIRPLKSWDAPASRNHRVNRRPRHQYLQEAYEATVGVPGMHVTVVVVDLNLFKQINDTFGHHVGDQVLQRTAHRLRSVVGPDALLARLGGDEFGIVVVGDAPLIALTEIPH